MTRLQEIADYGPWNPGIRSELPRAFQPLSTMFRDENVTTSLKDARELSDFTGLAPHDLVMFRPQRLVVHELLVRVMADLSVPDGTIYEDLGINFRQMTATILANHIAPRMDDIVRQYEALQREASQFISQELTSALSAGEADPSREGNDRRVRKWFFARRNPVTRAQVTGDGAADHALDMLAVWRRSSAATTNPLYKAAFKALIEIVSAIVSTRGRLVGDVSLLTTLVLRKVCNGYGSEVIGAKVGDIVRQAAGHEGYRLLPRQEHPVVMNVKGASAAGKSSMRPLQRHLANKLKIDWGDFALISPDIWRKYLLDYDTLGEATRYAGTLTGHEIELVDQKLDRYMAAKAKRGEISHLLIDRFRFDSFASAADTEAGGNLLTRFGDLVYMFFMVTPPEATVERAWKRGLQVGRFKALDDLLHHNVEAYEGMPSLFFTWALSADKRVHYEFLDNSVREGALPRTIAFGWNGEMNILDVKGLLDIDRYRKINIEARSPGEVYGRNEINASTDNTQFLKECARRLPAINLVEHASGRIYARIRDGVLTWSDAALLAEARQDPLARAGLDAIMSDASLPKPGTDREPETLDREQSHTLGQWGPKSCLLKAGS